MEGSGDVGITDGTESSKLKGITREIIGVEFCLEAKLNKTGQDKDDLGGNSKLACL